MSILSDIGTKIGSKIKELTTLVNTKLDKTAKAADSDKLDGLNSTQFLRSDTDDTFTGTLSLNGKHDINGKIIAGSGASLQVNGFMRVGSVIMHEVGSANDPLSTDSYVLKINNGILTIADNKVLTEASRTISASAPSGGVDGDIWIQV